MPKIIRYNGNLQAFASAAPGTERTIFGDTAQANDLTSQINAEFLRGWGIVGPSDQPSLEDFNGAMYTHGQLLSYLHQVGIPEYNATQEYHLGSYATLSGALYKSLINNNTGNNPATSFTQWREMPESTGHGECRLSVGTPTSLVLGRKNGRWLIINGNSMSIPAAGVTVTNAGLSANTFYYVYAFMSGATMTLELSVTGHSTHTDGVEIKNGDPTRTLVGAAYTNASTQFVRGQSFIGVLTWFNRQTLALAQSATTTPFTTGVISEITATDRISFINWADDGISVSVNGTMSLSAIATVSFNIYVNNVINRLANSGASGAAGQNINCAMAGNISSNEGVLNTTSAYASTTAGTVTAAFTNFVNMNG